MDQILFFTASGTLELVAHGGCWVPGDSSPGREDWISTHGRSVRSPPAQVRLRAVASVQCSVEDCLEVEAVRAYISASQDLHMALVAIPMYFCMLTVTVHNCVYAVTQLFVFQL